MTITVMIINAHRSADSSRTERHTRPRTHAATRFHNPSNTKRSGRRSTSAKDGSLRLRRRRRSRCPRRSRVSCASCGSASPTRGTGSSKRCVRGPGWRPGIASPTPKSHAVGSPRWDHGWCAGLRSKQWCATTAAPGSMKTSIASPSDAAPTRPASRSRASCSRSSTTAYETARSAASRHRHQAAA